MLHACQVYKFSIQYSVDMREGNSIKSLYEPSTVQKFINSIFKTVY